MGLDEEIIQTSYKSEFSKATINIIYTHSWLQQQHMEMFKAFGLTTPQFNILRILRGQYPKPSKVNLLIERMLDKSSNASRIVDKLEEKGLVERHQCKKDRRAVDVIISENGLILLKEIDAILAQWEKQSNTLTEDEASQLNYLLDKMRS